MSSRFYTLNQFIAPDFGLLVPNWSYGIAAEHYHAASHSYDGPLYILLTPFDAAVLINISPERERDAVALVCRLPHEGRINHAPTGSLREATTAESLSARSRLSAEPDLGSRDLETDGPIWVAGDTGLCVHAEPHRISLFRFQDGRCTDVIHAGDRHRIEPIGEE